MYGTFYLQTINIPGSIRPLVIAVKPKAKATFYKAAIFTCYKNYLHMIYVFSYITSELYITWRHCRSHVITLYFRHPVIIHCMKLKSTALGFTNF